MGNYHIIERDILHSNLRYLVTGKDNYYSFSYPVEFYNDPLTSYTTKKLIRYENIELILN